MPSFDSYFLTPATAAKAVELALPMINAAMDSQVAGESGFLYIVIMKPGFTPANSSFEDAILYEHAVGDREKWDADYGAFARAKARVAWKTGLDGHVVQELKPHLLQEGDTTLWGSIVLDDIVVGVSGAHPWYDEAFAGSVAMCLRALAKAGIAKERTKTLFLGTR
ncbi:hypothetical protein SAMN06265795_11154 [Noviherbaspirillum humi]|uniref:Uncharacterized protein n=1 Tax=Noviherbaspirillum humi TaxID=1688639 RepID=A0A239J3G5_9BURK|nr:hypothetical protein [Noviherbaspirillum humi]SNS99194.1 hypothetical protein SAMN06265795_11154 [Noviherbaspirillum humi]